ncbi:MAG: DUF5777 family beta-barrel protein [Thermoanaerobaculia bacterium]
MRNLVPAALLAVLLPACSMSPVGAQEVEPYGTLPNDGLGTRLINGPTPYPVKAHKWEVLFTHRFQQPANEGSSHDLWGLDSGADTGIGVAVGLTSRLDLALYRVSFQEDYEVAGKMLLLRQASGAPLTLSARAGADFLRRPGVEDSTRPFAQLLLARRFAPGVNLLLSPSWVADTPRLKNAFNVPVGLTFPLPGDQLVELEYVPANRDLDDSRDAWHVALSKMLGGHIFELVVGNSRATTVDQMLGGDSAAGFEKGDVRIGFNIVRDFGW